MYILPQMQAGIHMRVNLPEPSFLPGVMLKIQHCPTAFHRNDRNRKKLSRLLVCYVAITTYYPIYILFFFFKYGRIFIGWATEMPGKHKWNVRCNSHVPAAKRIRWCGSPLLEHIGWSMYTLFIFTKSNVDQWPSISCYTCVYIVVVGIHLRIQSIYNCEFVWDNAEYRNIPFVW